VVRIAVVGAGYVGLVTGTCLAQKGYHVTIVENNQNKINALLNGQVPFYEPGLDELVKENINNKRILFVSNIKEALEQKPEVIFSCVGTPPNEDGSADLSYVLQVAVEVGKSITQYCLVVNKSTVPVGSAEKVKRVINTQLADRGVSVEFDVASNPEFLKEGDALNDFLNPDRIVIGVQSKRAQEILTRIYSPFITNKDQLLVMNIESSELTKYASNAMLATRISFMNELSNLAEKVGADINQIKIGMAKDRRIGPFFLNAGIGYGGSCFPKDVRALVSTGVEYACPMSIIQAVEDVNDKQRRLFAEQILKYFGDTISTKHLGIWGLAFKPETDDLRCAPSLDIVKILLKNGAKVTVYDPVAAENFRALFASQVNYAKTSKEILEQCDGLIILTEWKEFLKYKPTDFNMLKEKVVFDGRNCFDPIEMNYSGIKYFCIGRNAIMRNTKNMLVQQELAQEEVL